MLEVLAERALAIASERLRQALNASGMVGTFAWRLLQSDTFYSDARLRKCSRSILPKADEGAPLSDYLAGIHPEDVQRIAEAINHTIVRLCRGVQSGSFFSRFAYCPLQRALHCLLWTSGL